MAMASRAARRRCGPASLLWAAIAVHGDEGGGVGRGAWGVGRGAWVGWNGWGDDPHAIWSGWMGGWIWMDGWMEGGMGGWI
jgi:hypothetical protein